MDEKVLEAVKKIRHETSFGARIGIILGSGLGYVTDDFRDTVILRFEDVPNFPVSSVEDGGGKVVAGTLSGAKVIVLSRRLHYYEGYTLQEVCFPVRVMAGLGVRELIITNAGGAVNESYSPGDIIVLKDHINLMGDNPLRGTTDFLDMTEAYSKELRTLAHSTAGQLGIELREGVYLALNGPSFETPAEIRMIKNIGGDIVGMSTVPEVIIARSVGIRVLGLSVISNMASGITGRPITHEEVIETTQKAADRFRRLLTGIVESLNRKLEENK